MTGLVSGGGVGADVILDGGQSVSMQLLQQIYKEVTGKSEKITKQYEFNHGVEFSDLENLNSKIEQLLEQYHVLEKVCSVTFFRVDDCNERYSSFDRARAYEAGSTSPIENVRIEYNFLIVLPVAKKPQPYKLVIDVHSREAIREKLSDGPMFQRRIMNALDKSTGQIVVEYVDYAVARTMINAVTQWFESVEMGRRSAVFGFIQRRSHNLPWAIKYSTAALVSLGFVLNFPVSDWQVYSVIAFAFVFIASGLSFQFGVLLDDLLSDMYYPSYLNLNRGDKRIISGLKSKKIIKISGAIVSLVGAVSINVFSAVFSKYIGV